MKPLRLDTTDALAEGEQAQPRRPDCNLFGAGNRLLPFRIATGSMSLLRSTTVPSPGPHAKTRAANA